MALRWDNNNNNNNDSESPTRVEAEEFFDEEIITLRGMGGT